MIVEFDKSFEKSLGKLGDKSLYPKIEEAISILEEIDSLIGQANIIKLSGFKSYYRFKLGDYRIGIERISRDTIRLIVVAHRKDIYNIFP